MESLLTADEVAAWLGIARPSVYRMVADGRLPSPLKLGRVVRWREAELMAVVAGAVAEREEQEKLHASTFPRVNENCLLCGQPVPDREEKALEAKRGFLARVRAELARGNGDEETARRRREIQSSIAKASMAMDDAIAAGLDERAEAEGLVETRTVPQPDGDRLDSMDLSASRSVSTSRVVLRRVLMDATKKGEQELGEEDRQGLVQRVLAAAWMGYKAQEESTSTSERHETG